MTSRIQRRWWVVPAGLMLLLLPGAAAMGWAQDSKSAALVKELTRLLDDKKLDSFAAKDPKTPDQFVGALYSPGAMLLVIAAQYSVPQILEERLAKKEYREVYVDLQSASVPASKIFVQDLQADGLKIRQVENQPFDSYESANKPVSFDNDWRRQKNLSEEEFAKSFAAADERYTQMLSVLIETLKKTS